MMEVKAKILHVMRARAAREEIVLGGRYAFTMATWNLRLAMEAEFPDEEWKSVELRKVLAELAMEGQVSKDTYRSRIGQEVWKLEVRDA
ncbi:TPA: eaa protein [Citrobacter freundii]|uniref:eaa protein n=1 Tax=Citrobacter freundii TaxID=546 RepID=UPI001BCFF3AB|nr:eaa protein [Citrobacter freundii]EIN8656645.1 eaa protein [Citrobacter freundii]HBZ9067939.1 eaa protein [Citrobacter freundii]HBZ9266762.1 eaa protein [Citrobacter freundii]HBZ9383530.1 eaa protein [Citrobacter freundii]HBZ9647257.1 eaa protein [Citrobacter freundii]